MNDARKLTKTTSNDAPVVYVVDDDPSIREALVDLFLSVRTEAKAFESAQDLLDNADLKRPGCILLDVRLPGPNGLDFQLHLEKLGNQMPIIFMTGHGDIPMTVRAMKAGAVDFLAKPFRDQDILDAVAVAFQKDRDLRRQSAANGAVTELAKTLTRREHEVMTAVVQGLMNKQIAFNLGISEITVKLHRGNVMRKMEARSVADLVRKAELLGL
ncbi:response regulator transcription factor [Neorhizobium galegae]|uniref:response regulator transcription factor n=1 Tax=Neorhizobium galegae TaxID=399 RepID=UPI0006224D01|nr:response regulator transcription factor [Neorhizobium galegae]CDZ30398.1 Nodulation protein W [Neorhizobium galegae bv. officinalis]KAA9384061.1 response regulator transcription factor [Neorhizobium galegae]MCM2498707.1 response regulator transcription factor [Neorhizobium galegae]MCQ1769031.1 response regulator transcription factor [Neorhizobium galegae]MCQ1781191.1 response regulator transcription factor [Neorhizobium galegae]